MAEPRRWNPALRNPIDPTGPLGWYEPSGVWNLETGEYTLLQPIDVKELVRKRPDRWQAGTPDNPPKGMQEHKFPDDREPMDAGAVPIRGIKLAEMQSGYHAAPAAVAPSVVPDVVIEAAPVAPRRGRPPVKRGRG